MAKQERALGALKRKARRAVAALERRFGVPERRGEGEPLDSLVQTALRGGSRFEVRGARGGGKSRGARGERRWAN